MPKFRDDALVSDSVVLPRVAGSGSVERVDKRRAAMAYVAHVALLMVVLSPLLLPLTRATVHSLANLRTARGFQEPTRSSGTQGLPER